MQLADQDKLAKKKLFFKLDFKFDDKGQIILNETSKNGVNS